MFRTVTIPGWITLAPASKLEWQLHQQAKDNRGIPEGTGRIGRDLAEQRNGVPVVLREPRNGQGNWQIGLHTRTYVAWLYESRHQDAYTIARVSPLRLRDHDQLARGCLLVRTSWQVVADHSAIPKGGRSHWQELWAQWQGLQAHLGDQRRAPTLNARHEAYLDTLDGLIDVTQRIDEEQRDSVPTYPYRAVTSTGERRHSASAHYVFEAGGDLVPDRGAFVQVQGEPGQRGQVTRVSDGQVTVRFDQPIDWDRIRQQGQLEQTSSNIVYDKQREAVALLRTRQARNHSLLSVLVDHKVRAVAPCSEEPAGELDEDQLVAFRRAMGVQDMTVVLGPPGTGKTRTIAEMVRSCALARDRGRVLVASHTNRAVDNVLAKLPSDVTVVRVGNEGKVDPEGKPFLLERQADDLRTEIVASVAQSLSVFQRIDVVARWTDELGRHLGELARADADKRSAERELDQVRRAAGGSAQSTVDEMATAVGNQEKVLSHQNRRIERLTRRRERSAAHASTPLIGVVARALNRSRERRIAACRTEITRIEPALAEARERLRNAERARDEVTRHIPEVQQAVEVLRSAARRCDESRTAAANAAQNCRASVVRMEVPPDTDDLSVLHAWLTDRIPVFAVRAKLLQDWHDDVSGATEQLYPELIRYADVIGATCIGAASRQEISEVDFDLAIIDEAGQIGVTDVLVPLVRAERAVLVGDHRQLPPFVDSELKTWARSLDDSVRGLLTRSALEILVGVLPESHVTLLTQQRRMPRIVADFVSDAFYEGKLRTMVRRVHRDPLFGSPLAFVDTTRLPDADRAERRVRDTGVVNPAEARLLCRLAAFYHERGEDWGVVVPYSAQIALIKDTLSSWAIDGDVINSNVGTVDSFQGGERDVILYGFTRSNRAGSVGFLDELRRANVAFTRPRQQLVLVGDMGMLLRATDQKFRELVTALRDYIRVHGDVKQYNDLMATLAAEGRAS